MTEEVETYSDIDIFKSALISCNYETRSSAISHLTNLAHNLSIVEIKDLISYISENLSELQEENLADITQQLIYLVPLIGGVEQAQTVLDILTEVLTVDEPLVRVELVQICREFCQALTDEQCQTFFFPIIEKLSLNQWFSANCSAAELLSVCYNKVNEETQGKIQNLVKVLVQDDRPLVRISSANSIIDLVQLLEVDIVKNDFIPVLYNISSDINEDVKSICIALAVSISKRLTVNEVISYIITTIDQLCNEGSWKVRYQLASQIHELQNAMPYKNLVELLLKMYEKLIQDEEAKVQITAIENLCKFFNAIQKACKDFEENFEMHIQNIIKLLLKNLTSGRVDKIKNILELNLIMKGKAKDFIMNEISIILSVETSMDLLEIVFENLIYFKVEENLKLNLFIAIKTVMNESMTHWRARRNVLLVLLYYIKFASTIDFEKCTIIYNELVFDHIFSIRRTAPTILPSLTHYYGIQNIKKYILPNVLRAQNSDKYSIRYIPLYFIDELLFPSLEDAKCLKEVRRNLEKLKNSSVSKLKVVKICKIFERIKLILLESKKNSDKFKNDNVADDLKFYAEDSFLSILKTNYYNFENTDMDYAEEIFELILNDFLDLTLKLSKDPVENVKVNAKNTLHQISSFIEQLDNTIADLKLDINLNDEKYKPIDKEIDDSSIKEDFSEVTNDVEIIVTELDTPNEKTIDKTESTDNLDRSNPFREVEEDIVEESAGESKINHTTDLKTIDKSELEDSSDKNNPFREEEQDIVKESPEESKINHSPDQKTIDKSESIASSDKNNPFREIEEVTIREPAKESKINQSTVEEREVTDEIIENKFNKTSRKSIQENIPEES